MSLQFPLGSGEISHLNFARTNTVSHYWSPVDHVLYSSSGGGGSGLTTNDVCNIVTNEVAAECSSWTLSGLPDGATNVLGPFYDGQVGWSLSFDLGDESYYGDIYASEDATEVVIECWEASAQEDYYIITATRTYKPPRNALGLAREKELPQNTPVDEILLNGADGKVYHFRIGDGGSIDIYTEVSP